MGTGHWARFVTCFFSFSFHHPLTCPPPPRPLYHKHSMSSAPRVDFIYSSEAAEREGSSEQGEQGTLGTCLLWAGLAVKVGVGFVQRTECTAPPPMQTASLENIMRIWVTLWRTCFSEFGLAVGARVILPFIVSLRFWEQWFPDHVHRGALREGLEL